MNAHPSHNKFLHMDPYWEPKLPLNGLLHDFKHWTLIWPGLVWFSWTYAHFSGCVWCLMRPLPGFLGAPGFGCWQADNVLVLGRPGGRTRGLPEEAHLLLLPAGKWKLLPHPLYVVLCVWDKRMSWARGKEGVVGNNRWVENHPYPPEHLNLLNI